MTRPKKQKHVRWPLRPTTAASPNANGMFYKRDFPLTPSELAAWLARKPTAPAPTQEKEL